MFNHFAECIRQSKSARQEAVQMNIFAALLCGLKGIGKDRSTNCPPFTADEFNQFLCSKSDHDWRQTQR